MAKRTRTIRNFRAPEPKGIKLNRKALPKSEPYVRPDVDPEEAAAFGQGEGRRGRRSVRSPQDERMAAASTRRTAVAGRRRERVDEDRFGDGEDAFDDNDEQPEDDDDEGDGDDDDEVEGEDETRLRRGLAPREEPETQIDERAVARMQAAMREGLPKPNVSDQAMTAQPQPAQQAQTVPLSPFAQPATTAGPGQAVTRVASRTVPAIFADRVSVGDVDRLWDWLRIDDPKEPQFLGRVHPSSQSLHGLLRWMSIEGEGNRLAMIRAIHHGPHHLGFAMLAPILAEERTALMHIYLRQEVRGQIAEFLVPLIEIAEQVVPGFRLAATSLDDGMRRLHRKILTPLGFTEHVMFVR